MFVDDWTREDLHKFLKWAQENFNLEDLKFKDKKEVDFHDFVSGTDHSIKETFHNKEIRKYYLEDCDGPFFKGYNDGLLLILKVFQLGCSAGPIVLKKVIEREKKRKEGES